ncbi:MAG: hypothetical protein RXR08_08685 [Sulfolobaceae archaeon]
MRIVAEVDSEEDIDRSKYGLRWAIEGIFLSIERKYGEDLRARSVIGLLAEAMQKVWAYDAMVNYAKNAMLLA